MKEFTEIVYAITDLSEDQYNSLKKEICRRNYAEFQTLANEYSLQIKLIFDQ